MKTTLISLSFLLALTLPGLAQEIPDDAFSPDSTSAEEVDVLGTEFGDGSKGATASFGSLRRYCPTPINQAGMPGGARLGLVFSYVAMTILKAKQGGWTAEQIRKEAFSVAFLFEMLPKKPDCTTGQGYVDAIRQVLMQTGNLKVAQYDNHVPSCSKQPMASQQEQAARYRIDALLDVFKRHEAEDKREQAIRQTLRNGRPVVVVLKIDRAFARLQSDTWHPDPLQMTGQNIWHPVVIVGYDDKRRAFEFLNSMGSSWGNGGFAWLSYDDLRYIDRALSPVDRPDQTPTVRPNSDTNPVVVVRPKPRPHAPIPPAPGPRPPAPRLRPVVTLRGEGSLRQAVLTGPESFSFSPMNVARRTTYYETTTPLHLEDRIQFLSDKLPRFGHVYILSVDAARKTKLHFPEPGESAYVADEAARLVFPRPLPERDQQGRLTVRERGFNKEQNGADWLIVLYSKDPLTGEQLSRWTSQLRVSETEVVPTLERLLGGQMVPWENIAFAPNALRFTVQSAQGQIVPLLIKINGF